MPTTNCSSLPTTPRKSTLSSRSSKKHTLPSNDNIVDFHIDNDLKKNTFQK